jgi:hypothetical protein
MFDGDESNISYPQLMESICESRELMKVEANLISPQNSRASVSLVQDCMTTIYLLTKENARFGKNEQYQLYMALRRPRREFDPRRTTGREIFMYILPETMPELRAAVTKKTASRLVHELSMYQSASMASEFVSDAQRLGLAYLALRGFSVAYSDTFSYYAPPGSGNIALEHARDESKVVQQLSGISSSLGASAEKAMHPLNNIKVMLDSGAKGKPANVMQSSACMGQQIIAGSRPRTEYDGRRCLPHFTVDETRTLPAARGYVASCLRDGLDVTEFFFTAQGGREGMTDTSIKSVTGDTSIVVWINGVSKVVQIGEWIDAQIAGADPSTITTDGPDQLNLQTLQLPAGKIAIPTCDSAGNVTVAAMSAVCRHDNDGVLYEVKTKSGRAVTVPGSKALLVWNGEAFCDQSVKDTKIGDFMPVIGKGSSNITINDVELDAVVEITSRICGPEEKLYDVTVPSTLNFALFNGLVVRDTSDTGALTRRQTKNFENLIVQYDSSVRDECGNVCQFKYGHDAMDPCKLLDYSLNIPLLPADSRTHAEMRAFFGPDYSKRDFFLPVDLRVLQRHSRSDTQVQLGLQFSLAELEDALQRSELPLCLRAHALSHFLAETDHSDFGYLVSRMQYMHVRATINPGEAVGTIAAQSWGQVSTQSSLNSVDGATTLLLLIDGKDLHKTTIGEYVDAQLAAADESQKEMHPNNTEFAWLRGDVKILAGQEDASVSWQTITAVTRHPVLTKKLLEVTLKSGRVIRATAAKSFVTVDIISERLVPTLGSELVVGDYVPVALAFPKDGAGITTVDLKKYLSPNEFLFSSNVHKLISLSAANPGHILNTSGISHAVFKRAGELGCAVPTTCYNSAVRRYGPNTVTGAKTLLRIKPNMIYTQLIGETCIPEHMPLDRDFGWLCGIYVAEGSCDTDCSTLQIAGIEEDIKATVLAVGAKYGLRGKTHGGTWTSLNSKVMCTLLARLFGRGAANKRIHTDLFLAPDEWVGGFMSGYLDGDGFVGPSYIKCSSISAELVADISALCARFGVFTQHSTVEPKPCFGGAYMSKKQYNLTWRAVAAGRLRPHLALALKRKAALLANMSVSDRVTGDKYVEDVIADPIVSIKEIDWTEKVYDLTVDGFKTFNSYDGVVFYDTFHLAGLGMSMLSCGFELLKQLYNASKKGKNIYRLFLSGEARSRKEAAMEVADVLNPVMLKNAWVSCDVYYRVPACDEEWVRLWRDVYGDTLCGQMFPQLYSSVCIRYRLRTQRLAYLAEQTIEKNYGNQFVKVIRGGTVLLVFLHKLAFVNRTEHTPFSYMEKFSYHLNDSILLCGIAGIEKIYLNHGRDKTAGTAGEDEFYIEVEGGDINEAMCAHLAIDELRSYHTNPVLAQYMGVEGAACVLLNQFKLVVENTEHIDIRHCLINVDAMCSTGEVKAINRHTQNSLKASGPLERATNEQSLHVLTESALNCRSDSMAGLSACIAAGVRINAGTGLSKIMERNPASLL